MPNIKTSFITVAYLDVMSVFKMLKFTYSITNKSCTKITQEREHMHSFVLLKTSSPHLRCFNWINCVVSIVTKEIKVSLLPAIIPSVLRLISRVISKKKKLKFSDSNLLNVIFFFF